MAREPLIVLDIHGLKCDAPGCGWSDMTVPLVEYPEYLNARCPRCKSNVLTEADFKTVWRTVRIVNWVNRWLSWVPRKRGPWVEHNFSLDGSGRARPAKSRAGQPSAEGVSTAALPPDDPLSSSLQQGGEGNEDLAV